ncbi:hypothetical protein K470DRAFT_265373 [Piedraia hortae CBS 480.64]|uniref:Uncharacterized protein n=1 Tax=Piedraia hortae CBS 480.64 TaxID=1314780 RepID=A0A6A7BV83_9PEZI|nr:hypothetical protein K470DRAFT_265373 [Piedraia hortae CBS 480.64]
MYTVAWQDLQMGFNYSIILNQNDIDTTIDLGNVDTVNYAPSKGNSRASGSRQTRPEGYQSGTPRGISSQRGRGPRAQAGGRRAYPRTDVQGFDSENVADAHDNVYYIESADRIDSHRLLNNVLSTRQSNTMSSVWSCPMNYDKRDWHVFHCKSFTAIKQSPSPLAAAANISLVKHLRSDKCFLCGATVQTRCSS